MRLIDPDAIESPLGRRFAWRCYEPMAGDVIEREHPFTRVETTFYDFNGSSFPEFRWRPGAWLNFPCGPNYVVAGYHKCGKCKIEVKAVVAIKGFPRRVCYTRQFCTPDGKELKRSGLFFHSITKFRKVCAGDFGFEAEKCDDMTPMKEN